MRLRVGGAAPFLIQLLVLLIRGRGKLHFVSKGLLGFGTRLLRENLQLSIVFNHLVAEEDFLDHFVVRARVLEEGVVHLSPPRRVDPDKVASPLILKESLFNVFFVLQICRLFQRLHQGRVLHWVLAAESVDVVLEGQAVLTPVDVLARHAVWGDARALNAVAKVLGFLAFVVEPLHSVLNFVKTLLLSIESFHTHDVESIADQV